MKVTSYGDEIEIVDQTVVLRKRGVANVMASGDRSIPIRSITAIGFAAGGTFSPGFIQFSYGKQARRGRLIEATQDPDAFVFNKASNTEMEAFPIAVESLRSEIINDKAPNMQGRLAGELERLAMLHHQNLLAEEEFVKAKARLMSGAT